MNDETATLERRAIVEALAHLNGMGYDRARSMLAEVERAAAEKAWDAAYFAAVQWAGNLIEEPAVNPYRKETR